MDLDEIDYTEGGQQQFNQPTDQLVVRQVPDNKGVNTVPEEAMTGKPLPNTVFKCALNLITNQSLVYSPSGT